MNAMTYVPEIDIALRAGNYSILVQRAGSDLNAPHIALALCDAVTALGADVEAKDKELEEAYAEQGRLEGIIDGKDDDVDKLRDELEDAQGEIESMSEEIAELRARLARHAQGDAPDAMVALRRAMAYVQTLPKPRTVAGRRERIRELADAHKILADADKAGA